MNPLEHKLVEINAGLYDKLCETVKEVESMLVKYDTNFPTYTDHSIMHTREVFNLVANFLTKDEINNLNADEIYILSMACYLHDIGMCVPKEKIAEIKDVDNLIQYGKEHENLSNEEYIRNIHHELSYKFIMEEWQILKIPSIKYAKAIGLVAQGHRKVHLDEVEVYEPKFYIRTGTREFVCLPYLASILRIGDELDITNIRTPKILTKYYIPDNEFSKRNGKNIWQPHRLTLERIMCVMKLLVLTKRSLRQLKIN